jgi:hypothetical protein
MDWTTYAIDAVLALIGVLHVLPNDKVEAFGENFVGKLYGWITIATAKAGKFGKLVGFVTNTSAHFFIGLGRALDKVVNATHAE